MEEEEEEEEGPQFRWSGVEAVGAQRRNDGSRRLWITSSRHQLVLLHSHLILSVFVFSPHFLFALCHPRPGRTGWKASHVQAAYLFCFSFLFFAFPQDVFAVGDKATCSIFSEYGTVGVPAGFGGRREKVLVRLMGEQEVCKEVKRGSGGWGGGGGTRGVGEAEECVKGAGQTCQGTN